MTIVTIVIIVIVISFLCQVSAMVAHDHCYHHRAMTIDFIVTSVIIAILCKVSATAARPTLP